MTKSMKAKRKVIRSLETEIYRPTRNVVSKSYGSKRCLIFNLADTSRMFEIDGIAALVWKKMNGRNSLAKIFAAVQAAHRNEDPAWIERQSKRLLADLKKAGLVEVVK